MTKLEVEWCKKIEIWWLLKDIKEKGGLKRSVICWEGEEVNAEVNIVNSEGFIHLRHSDLNYRIKLTTTKCAFGGIRYWFVCPLSKNGFSCNRRVGVIYQGGDSYFGCRHCFELTYTSKNLSRSGFTSYLYKLIDNDIKIEKMHSRRFNQSYRGRQTRNKKTLDELTRRQAGFYTKQIGEKNKNKGRNIDVKVS